MVYLSKRFTQYASASSEGTRRPVLKISFVPLTAFGMPGEIEESDVRTGTAAVIGEEKVIGLDVVLVDGFFDQAHAEDVREEGVVLFGAACDGGDVVDSS